MNLYETMKSNKIVVGVKHIEKHSRDLCTIKNLLKYLKDRETKFNHLGGGYYSLIVKEGGLVFIFSVQRTGKLNKIVNWSNCSLFDYVRKNNNINDALWRLV